MNIKFSPIPVERALQKLGKDLCDARKRRRIPMSLAAERAGISRITLSKIEKGDRGVSLGAYAAVMFTMGMIDRLADLVDQRHDAIGMELDAESLPKRIRISRKDRGI